MAVKNTQICPKCLSKSTKKIGGRRGIQRYKCNDCDKKFQLKRRNKQLQKIIFHKYIYKRQTLDDLASAYKHSIPWIQKQIFEYEPAYKIHKPRAVNLICNATFYDKRKDKLGTLVFKDCITKEVLIWKHIQSETIKDYKHLLNTLLEPGYTINSNTIDGKRGLYKAFEDYSIQMCHFHQRRIIQRYITKHPKLQASNTCRRYYFDLLLPMKLSSLRT